MSFDRVLPKPNLFHERPQGFLPKISSNLLDHKIMKDDVPKSAVEKHRDASSTRYAAEADDAAAPSSLGRARVGSLQTKDHPIRDSSAWSNGAKSASSKDSPRFCICQPDPKIPRPRNAFILYRQHYQAAVVAQNPGVPNPDISKIIGEQWRGLSEEVKDDWRALAEEEKIRHQQQYPDYRYTPRRYGRDGGSRSNGAGLGHNPPGSLCDHCGGRVMGPPVVSPETPFTPNGIAEVNLKSHPPNAVTARSYGCHQSESARTLSPIKVGSAIDTRHPRPRQMEENGAQSPDAKRRRFNSHMVVKPGHHSDSRGDSQYPMSPYTPRSDSHPRGLHRAHRGSRDYPRHDPSLQLPPLQTTTNGRSSMTPVTPFSQDESTVENTVMTIPVLNKIKLLAMISPPISPSFRHPTAPPRGAVIAVDGQDPAMVEAMVDHLNNALEKEGKYKVKVFRGPEVRPRGGTPDSDKMGDGTVDYLDTISAWHRISDEIIKSIVIPTLGVKSDEGEDSATSGVSPKTIVTQTTNLQIESPAHSRSTSPMATQESGIFPIALVPRYQLTTADSYACSIPIKDSYAPLDHWQWMATLWRACVGPDVTVYVRDCEKEEMERQGGNAVELRLQEARTIMVRRSPSSTLGFDEKTLKRVGFEVEDYLTQ